MLNSLEMTGRAQTHVAAQEDLGCLLAPAAAAALREMRLAAASEGIDLAVVSGYRDFQRQLAIWNAKFRGERPLSDRNGEPVEARTLSAAQRVDTILLWSALPGASRHHWGTDFDVIDRAHLAPGYSVRLSQDEYAPGGLFHALTEWLDANMHRFGFFRPYRIDRGGVQPEAWHLSYAPAAVPILEMLTIEALEDALIGAPIEGREVLLARLPELHARFVVGVDKP